MRRYWIGNTLVALAILAIVPFLPLLWLYGKYEEARDKYRRKFLIFLCRLVILTDILPDSGMPQNK